MYFAQVKELNCHRFGSNFQKIFGANGFIVKRRSLERAKIVVDASFNLDPF